MPLYLLKRKCFILQRETGKTHRASIFNCITSSTNNTHLDDYRKIKKPSQIMFFKKHSPVQAYPLPIKKRIVWRPLVFLYYS